MNRRQIEAVFSELEASNPLDRAHLFLDLTTDNGSSCELVVRYGEYDLFLDDGLLVMRYCYTDGDMLPFSNTPDRRHVGVNFIPFECIKLVELGSGEVQPRW